MKTKWKVIVAVILAVVISVGSISAYKYITSPKEESIPLETTLEDAAELTTQKMIISDVFKSTKGNIPLINKNKFLVQYKKMHIVPPLSLSDCSLPPFECI